MDWLSVVLPVEPGETEQTNANRVSGITVVSNRKDCPGTTSVSSIARMPCLVFIVPVVPAANGPLSAIDCTSGFHSGQVLVSDQIFHAVWGLAFVSTERSFFPLPASSIAWRCATPRDSAEGIPRPPERSR